MNRNPDGQIDDPSNDPGGQIDDTPYQRQAQAEREAAQVAADKAAEVARRAAAIENPKPEPALTAYGVRERAEEELAKLTVTELRTMAKEKGIPTRRFSKSSLIKALTA